MKVKAVIDEIEKGYHAVLFVGNEEIEVHWPHHYLPEGAKEGDILAIELTIDKQATDKQREKVSSLIEKLKNKNKK